MEPQKRFSSSAGIAIGPILFIVAILAVLAAAMSTGNSNFQTASVMDRIQADISTQANLIRNTINNCNLQYKLALSMGSEPVSTDPPGGYPASNTTTGTSVSSLVCDPAGAASLWGDILLPPPTKGFDAWMYVNAGDSGGRCFWTLPSSVAARSNQGIVAGLTRAAARFNSSTTVDSSHEVNYDPASASQKFIVWITLPSGDISTLCEP